MTILIESRKSLPNFTDYKKSFGKINENKNEGQLKNHYESCTKLAKEQLLKHPFWIELRNSISEWDALYRQESGAEGLYKGTQSDQASLVIKPWDSLLQKAYKKNVIENRNWPEVPDQGWVKHDCWFARVGDILRTQFVCRYIDGVEFISNRLVELAKKHNLEFNNQLKATNEGYYAGHVDLKFDFTITDFEFENILVSGWVEFQITTQLKEVVKQLMHVHYESDRIKSSSSEVKEWQWDYNAPSFDANYLGHVMHYLEVQILKLRRSHERRVG
jgi:hypothetical protein